MKIFKKNKSKNEEIDINEILPKNVKSISVPNLIKTNTRKYLVDTADFLKKGFCFSYNENNSYLDEQGAALINSLIISLYNDNKTVCENILNTESESELLLHYDLHLFLTEQLDLLKDASHKSWEQSEYKNEYGVVTVFNNTLTEVKNAFEEKELYKLNLLSCKNLQKCNSHFTEHVLCNKHNFENELVK